MKSTKHCDSVSKTPQALAVDLGPRRKCFPLLRPAWLICLAEWQDSWLAKPWFSMTSKQGNCNLSHLDKLEYQPGIKQYQ